MVIKFICEYNGKGFHGFQRQGSLRTVQSVLEEALSKYFGERIKIVASGRTDTGVHAMGQVCSFWIASSGASHPPRNDMYKVCAAINAFLPLDVSVRDFEVMPDDFHAQFSAKSKTYIYKCYVSKFRSALRDGTHLQLYSMPDIEKMKAAAKGFVGTRSFKEYTTDKVDSRDFVRTIYCFDVIHNQTPRQPNGCHPSILEGNYFLDDEIHLIINGSGFMRNMVRILCGAVLGMGKTLPAHGLVLESVQY